MSQLLDSLYTEILYIFLVRNFCDRLDFRDYEKNHRKIPKII